MEDFDESQGNIKSKKQCCFCNKKLLILGVFIFLLGFTYMIVLFIIPYNKIQTNKTKYPEATFDKPNFSVILIHFLLNGSITTIGILLIIAGFFKKINCCFESIIFIVLILILAISGMWIAELFIGFTKTKNFKYDMILIDDLSLKLIQNPPIDFIFLYTKDIVYQLTCYKNDCNIVSVLCYSKAGVKIPIKSYLTSPIYDLSKTPDLFLFKIDQEINMTNKLSSNFEVIRNSVETCDILHKKVFDFYPLISNKILVYRKKVPACIGKKTRIASIFFGVGVYYELNYKSVPLFSIKQTSNADVVQDINYTEIASTFDCRKLGECSIINQKPNP